MSLFSDTSVNLESLRKKAFNYRWAVLQEGIIPLTAADPDFPVAEPIKQALNEYVKDGYFSYGPPNGIFSFREAICNYYERHYEVKTHPDFILPVNSAAYGLFVAAKFLLKPGENAIIPNPVDFLFRKSIENAGAVVKTCSLNKENAEFNLEELAQLIDSHTRAIFICNPNNPLGKTISKEHLSDLIKFAAKHDLWIVSDEIWADIDFEGHVTSIASSVLPNYSKRIIVSGLSKNYGLAGLRIGYIISPDNETSDKILQVSGHLSTAFGLAGMAQAAGTAALNDSRFWLNSFLIHLTEMRQLTLQFINEMEVFDVVSPNATYLAFPKLLDPSLNSTLWVEDILKKSQVALIPGGTNWFESASEGHIRICYATSRSILMEAFDRMLSCKI
jgi:aspartate/methionine/tyrosine aminotransferase